MLQFAGVVVAWSGSEPRYEAVRIPAEGLVFGRAHADPSDDRISGNHVRLTAGDDRIRVADAGSRNGTYVAGHAVGGEVATSLPAIMRTGRTVSLLVEDVRPYEERVPVVGGSLGDARKEIEQAALAEDHVAIIGGGSCGRELALAYANKLGGNHVEIDGPIAGTIEDAVRPRTVIVRVDQTISAADARAIKTWLETDVRFVTLLHTRYQLANLDHMMQKRLMARLVEAPAVPIHEFTAMVQGIVRSRSPKTSLHATAIEVALIDAHARPQGSLARLRDCVDACARRKEPLLRGDALLAVLFPERGGTWAAQGLGRPK